MEECPNCGQEIEPIEMDDVKMCPLCKFRWFESGGSWRKSTIPPGAE